MLWQVKGHLETLSCWWDYISSDFSRQLCGSLVLSQKFSKQRWVWTKCLRTSCGRRCPGQAWWLPVPADVHWLIRWHRLMKHKPGNLWAYSNRSLLTVAYEKLKSQPECPHRAAPLPSSPSPRFLLSQGSASSWAGFTLLRQAAKGTRFAHGPDPCHFCSPSVCSSSVTWPHLTTQKAGPCRPVLCRWSRFGEQLASLCLLYSKPERLSFTPLCW